MDIKNLEDSKEGFKRNKKYIKSLKNLYLDNFKYNLFKNYSA